MAKPCSILRLIALLFLIGGCVTSEKLPPSPSGDAPSGAFKPCSADPERQKIRSQEIQSIVKADQEERQEFQKKTINELMQMTRHDEERRKRVGEIFGEGCFSTAADFAAAALVFQHGDIPEHFFQTFMWAKRAVELGDESQKSLIALGIDRYLTKSGYRQLFGSQASATHVEDPKSCYCLDAVEHSFPDSLRKKFTGKALKDYFTWLRTLNEGKKCPAEECKESKRPSPRGTVPGFW